MWLGHLLLFRQMKRGWTVSGIWFGQQLQLTNKKRTNCFQNLIGSITSVSTNEKRVNLPSASSCSSVVLVSCSNILAPDLSLTSANASSGLTEICQIMVNVFLWSEKGMRETKKFTEDLTELLKLIVFRHFRWIVKKRFLGLNWTGNKLRLKFFLWSEKGMRYTKKVFKILKPFWGQTRQESYFKVNCIRNFRWIVKIISQQTKTKISKIIKMFT